MILEIDSYIDGESIPHGYEPICAAWKVVWAAHYEGRATLRFRRPKNIKMEAERVDLPKHLAAIERVRNPDMYFVEATQLIELGGVEVTDHSPDGSNIEKRYPYLWISRQVGVDAFVATPYLKGRPTGQANRFPHRHATRNLEFLSRWQPNTGRGTIQQLLPVRDLQASTAKIPTSLQRHLASWRQLGAFFAHRLAEQALGGSAARAAQTALEEFRTEWLALANECKANTTHTEPSTLYRDGERWIQVYNLRPDSGHWERGEGQFDSIDGRLMFTLDEIELLPPSKRPKRFEFWMPQFAHGHAWAAEQRERGFGSKRFRNVCVTLPRLSKIPFVVRFADELRKEDWEILRREQTLTLERLDAAPGVYRITDLVPARERASAARRGLKGKAAAVLEGIERLLGDPALYLSTHRAYNTGWEDDLTDAASRLSRASVILAPRLPAAMLAAVRSRVSCRIVPAEECDKLQLLALRQVHRARPNEGDEQ